MKLIKHGLFAICTLAIFSLQTSTAQSVQPDDLGFIIATPDDLFQGGARSEAIYGDPSKPGLYAMRITFPPGAGSRPHYHSTARYITVIKGTWYTSWGPKSDIYNPDDMLAVPEGTFIYQPPEGHHYDMAKDEEVIVQIMGMGPVITTQIPQPEQ
ncbi:MAG: cupin domain-containing protein [Pseudohongiellaceae bacterium]